MNVLIYSLLILSFVLYDTQAILHEHSKGQMDVVVSHFQLILFSFILLSFILLSFIHLSSSAPCPDFLRRYRRHFHPRHANSDGEGRTKTARRRQKETTLGNLIFHQSLSFEFQQND